MPTGLLDRQVPREPRLIGGVKGHNFKSISLLAFRSPLRAPGSLGLWPGGFASYRQLPGVSKYPGSVFFPSA